MKNTIRQLLLATSAVAALVTSAPQASAADLSLNGTGYYELGPTPTYYSKGASQTGRYQNFGRGFYHTTRIGMRKIANNSFNRSGALSFEFWAMPYYGATTGSVLMTRGLPSLPAMGYYSNPTGEGTALFLDRRQFPELNLWELTRSGWQWRDALTFPTKTRL